MAEVRAFVARIVSESELIVNRGSQDGVALDMIFEVVDNRVRDVKDPRSGENLGSIDRAKAKVVVTEVGDRIALARPFGRARSWVSLGGSSRSKSLLSDDTWPEGVVVGDEAVHRGEFRKRE
jgi:hypothetical protein